MRLQIHANFFSFSSFKRDQGEKKEQGKAMWHKILTGKVGSMFTVFWVEPLFVSFPFIQTCSAVTKNREKFVGG
jgi:hypothetical protein